MQINTEVFPPTVYNSWTNDLHLAFFLPANEHPTSYEDVFRHTVSDAAELGVNVFSNNYLCRLHNAVTTVWPDLEVKACRLHFGQSCWRKMQSLELSKMYGKKDSEGNLFLKKIFGLSLLPPAEVCDCFAFGFLSNIPNDKRVEEFCNYILENYIDADSTFPLAVSPECTTSSLRTINTCELIHAQFNAVFYITHHTIFVPDQPRGLVVRVSDY